MKNFKEMLDTDLGTFYNTGEFAEVKRIKYDGVVKNIPVIFDLEEMKSRKDTVADNAEGIVQDITVVRAKLSDFEKEPRQGARIWIEGELYKIEDERTEYNELILSLERFDE
jgi:hypothetical protein